MLTVRNLCKRYGDLTALRDVSFDVSAGEVVGFLGPNGAGKSTTMRIVTGFIPATSGAAAVDGYDVTRSPLEVRRRVGYLPEHTPLYTDMRVRDYLSYRARIKGVPRREVRKRVDYVIERTWLEDRTRQLIGTLSKGYRQRVGIADAMVGNPRLLILDEPTIGLDPNQVREVRKLLQELGQTHTLLLSTHILSEVEAACSRVIIIAQGRAVADDSVAGLLAQHQQPTVLVSLDNMIDTSQVTAKLGALPAVASVDVLEGGLDARQYRVQTQDSDVRAGIRAVSGLIAAEGWPLFELTPERVTLEQIFVRLTQDGPREEAVA